MYTPSKLLKSVLLDPEYRKCTRESEKACSGRITLEHALMYAGKQVQERWAIIPLCYYHHLGAGLNKRWNIKKAMSRATDDDRKKYPRLHWGLIGIKK